MCWKQQLVNLLGGAEIQAFTRSKLRQYQIYIDDVVSIHDEVFLRLLPRQNLYYLEKEKQRKFICGTIRNIIREKHREQLKSIALDNSEIDQYYNPPTVSYAETVELWRLIKRLRPEYQEIIIWHDLDDLTYQAISAKYLKEQKLKISETALRKRHERALKKMRQMYGLLGQENRQGLF